eukprot:3196759-Amphidinium_carterae.1
MRCRQACPKPREITSISRHPSFLFMHTSSSGFLCFYDRAEGVSHKRLVRASPCVAAQPAHGPATPKRLEHAAVSGHSALRRLLRTPGMTPHSEARSSKACCNVGRLNLHCKDLAQVTGKVHFGCKTLSKCGLAKAAPACVSQLSTIMTTPSIARGKLRC